MRIWKMLSCHIVLLMLTWRFSEASGNLQPVDEDLDQIATASFIQLRNLTDNNSTLERPLIRDVDITTIRYENSNGFVPITPESNTVTTLEEASYAENVLDRNFSSEKHLSLFIREPKNSDADIDESLENNPFYSTESRIFLNLMRPITNRRSSSSRDSTDDFELLRINDNTPSVASYQNFYNSLTSESDNQNSNGRDSTAQHSQPQFYEDHRMQNGPINDSKNAPRDEKPQQNYSFNYPDNPPMQDQKNAATGMSQYFSYTQLNDNNNNRNNKNNYDYPKADDFDYNSQIKDENMLNYRANYDQRDYRFNQQNPPATDVTLRQKHPMQENNKLLDKQNSPMRTKPSSLSNFDDTSQRNQNFKPSPRQEETVSYFEHEALFNRDDVSGQQNFDKNEEADDGEDLSDEKYEYIEITEKPKRYRKQKKRPNASFGNSGRLPKEHRDFDEEESSPSLKQKTHSRQKPRGHKSRANIWLQNEDESGEESIDATAQSTVNSENRKQRLGGGQNRRPKDNGWSNVSPNIEISHSSGIEIDQIGKPKLVLPVKVNLVPVANFDHETALGNSQGFDISNAVLQNYVTATPITFGNISPVAPILNTPQNIFGQNVVKTLQNLQSQQQNAKTQGSGPEAIVGQNAFHNPVHTILVPQQNYQTQLKLGQNLRNLFSTNGQNSFPHNPTAQSHSFNFFQHQNTPVQNLLGNSPVVQNPLIIQNQNAAQSFQNFNGNQVQSNGQVNGPHPTPQTFESYPQQTSNYNVQVNPRGLQGHSLPLNQNFYNPPSSVTYSTTSSTPNYSQSEKLDVSESNGNKNFVSGSNGQFLASASLTVGEQIQNQINPQNLRPQLQDSFQAALRNDNFFPKIKTFNQIAEGAPTTTTLNFNGQQQSGLGAQQQFGRDYHHTNQFEQASHASAQTYKNQNQQILKVANEIFESTLERLKQMQNNQNSRTDEPGILNTSGLGKTHDSQAQNSGMKNVDIVNQNAFNNPYGNSNSFGGLSLTTPFPIFTTTGFSTAPRTPSASSVGQTPTSINGYANSLIGIGAREKDLKTSPATNFKPNSPELRLSPVLFNPINFVPNLETLKNQNALNSKYSTRESQLQGLNLVPIIPGGNFYRNSYLAQEDLFSKPKLNSDLQKYAQEMFKESLRTIYNTRQWNNDHKGQSSEISTVTASPNGRDELQNLKFSLPDIKPSKQVLEAHYTESGAKDADLESPKRLQSQAQDLGEGRKPDFNLPAPISFEPVRFYYKPNIHLTRPTMADLNHPDSKLESDLGGSDYIHDFLIPPKPNAFISKSPFNDVIPKRRPRPKKPTIDTGKVKFSRPLTGVAAAAASGTSHHSFPFDNPSQNFFQNRPAFEQEDEDFYPDYQNSHSGSRGPNFQLKYPSLTTSNPMAEDFPKPSFQSHDFNNPRLHNLMGLLRKNKRLPPGSSQSYLEKKDDTDERFENRKPRDRSFSLLENKSDDVDNIDAGLNSTQTEQS